MDKEKIAKELKVSMRTLERYKIRFCEFDNFLRNEIIDYSYSREYKKAQLAWIKSEIIGKKEYEKCSNKEYMNYLTDRILRYFNNRIYNYNH